MIKTTQIKGVYVFLYATLTPHDHKPYDSAKEF